MSASATPRPWALRLGSLRASVETPSGNWFKSHKDGESESGIVADARLIAAAPDLYEAAAELVSWYGPLNPTKHPPEINGAWLRLTNALAKARGDA